MNEVQIFSSPEFGEIRTAGDRNNPLFCLADVCKAVGLTPKGVNQRLSDEVISNYPIIDSLERTQMALFVSEDGLYDVILDSRKPEAKAFRKWITSEVLSAIRKHGASLDLHDTATSSGNMKYMTSLQIAGITGKQHKDVLEAIRNMEPAWVKITGRKFPLSEYVDSTGRRLPCYQLKKTECLYIATKFNDEARAKLIIRWEELERERMFGGFKIPQTYSEALTLAATQSKQIDQQQKVLVLQAPKVLFATTIEDSDEYCLVDVLAKVLKQNGIDMGQNRLFKWLHNHKYLCSKGGDKNHPTQKAMDLGIFRIVTHIIEDKDGRAKTKRTTKLTNKGLSYFVNKFLSKDRVIKS